MPTDRFACLAAGAGLMLALLVAGARLPVDWHWAAHFLCFAAVTALLWRGTAGRARLAVLTAVIAVAALDWLHQSIAPGRGAELADFVAGAVAAAAVSGALFIRGKYLCAESSEP
jgi:VanZ family protein